MAIFLATVVQFFHESPRWLITKGHEERARSSFARYNNHQPDSPEVDFLVAESSHAIEIEQAMAHQRSFTDIFHGLDLKRTHIALLVLLGNAITGIQFVIPYTALFLTEVGLTNAYVLNVAISSCGRL